MSQSSIQDRTVHSQQHGGSVRNDSVLCDVAAFVENLNDEQWIAVTGGMTDIPRLDFVEMCVVMISRLSRCAYQLYKPLVQILDPSAIHMEASKQKSPGAAGSVGSRGSPLDIPFVHALCVDILHEVKRACLVAIETTSSSGSFTGSGDGLMARCVQLEEETEKMFFSRLKALDITAQKPDASRCSDKREWTALELNDVTQQLMAAILAVMENSCHDRENAEAASYLSHVVAEMVKVFASPEAYENKCSLGSFYSALKQVPPIWLTSAFVGKVHKTVLLVLLRLASCPFVGSESIPTPRENAVLSYVSTAWTIVTDITDIVLEVLVSATEERFCSNSTKMFSRIQHKVHQFMILRRMNGLTEPDSGEDDPSAVPCNNSLGKETCTSQKPTTTAAISKELDDDGGGAVACLEAFSPEVSTYVSSDTEDVAGTSSCFELTDIPHAESTSENREMSLKQKPSTLPKRKLPKVRILKKYFSRRRNAVSPLAPNQACALDTDPLMQNHLQNLTVKSSEIIFGDGTEAPASTSQQVDNSCDPDAAEKPRKHIITRFFLSIAKSLQSCIRNSEN